MFHLAQVQVFVYCLVLVSVVQVVWPKSLHEMHRTEPFFVIGNALGADGTRVNFWWSRVGLNDSCECDEEEHDCRRVIPP